MKTTFQPSNNHPSLTVADFSTLFRSANSHSTFFQPSSLIVDNLRLPEIPWCFLSMTRGDSNPTSPMDCTRSSMFARVYDGRSFAHPTQALGRVRKKKGSGHKGATSHSGRRSFITELASKGVELVRGLASLHNAASLAPNQASELLWFSVVTRLCNFLCNIIKKPQSDQWPRLIE
jgi:hypothetical protein